MDTVMDIKKQKAADDRRKEYRRRADIMDDMIGRCETEVTEYWLRELCLIALKELDVRDIPFSDWLKEYDDSFDE